MLTEAIILAGGKGTRLSSLVKEVPKPIAMVGNRPFLHYQFEYLITQKVERVILSVGYMHEKIRDLIGKRYKSLEIEYVIEEVPKGTGGAIKYALEKVYDDQVIVLNGDTFFPVSLSALVTLHIRSQAVLTLALKPVPEAERFGGVRLENQQVLQFLEKGTKGSGLINGGIYCLNRDLLSSLNLGETFSFEAQALPLILETQRISGMVFEDYFIDMGIPEDFVRAQSESAHWIAKNQSQIAPKA